MVSIITLISGYLCLICFVAVRPSITGIRTSMRIRSSLKREHSESACRPLAASPTISMSGSSKSMFWRLSLVSSWSSTTAKRVSPPTYSGEISVPTSLFPPLNNWPTSFMSGVRSPQLQGTRPICAVASSCRSRKRYDRRNEGTGLRVALNLELATKHADPLPHSRKTDPLTRTAPQRFECGRVEPTPEIPDLQIDFCVPPPQLYLQPLRPRVLAYVGQRLLRDAEERDLHRSWQALISKMFLAVDPVTFFIQAFDLQGDGGCESEVVECRWPQVRDDPARIRDCRPYLPEYPIQLSPALLRLWDVAPGEGLQILMCGNRNLGQTVVNFVGHPASLLFLGSQQPRYQVLQRTLPVAQLLVEPGVLESARNLAGQATYYVVSARMRSTPPSSSAAAKASRLCTLTSSHPIPPSDSRAPTSSASDELPSRMRMRSTSDLSRSCPSALCKTLNIHAPQRWTTGRSGRGVQPWGSPPPATGTWPYGGARLEAPPHHVR